MVQNQCIHFGMFSNLWQVAVSYLNGVPAFYCLSHYVIWGHIYYSEACLC